MFPPPKIDLKSLTGHTPGPWIAVGRRVEHTTDSVPDICTTAPEAMEQDGRSDAECCANARLIAAAPLLLAEVATLRDRVRELTLYAMGVEAQRGKLAARLEQTRTQLKSVQWSGGSMDRVGACPCCGCIEDEGHLPMCELANVLEEEPSVSPERAETACSYGGAAGCAGACKSWCGGAA